MQKNLTVTLNRHKFGSVQWNNNNNNNHDECCHHGRAIARVHSVHAMNTETVPDGREPLDQADRLEPQARL